MLSSVKHGVNQHATSSKRHLLADEPDQAALLTVKWNAANRMPVFLLLKGYCTVFQYRDQHCFSCINVCQVPWEVLKTEAQCRGFQHLPRDLANVNILENNVWSLLLHDFNEMFGNICEKCGTLFCLRLTVNAWLQLFINIRLPGPRASIDSRWPPSSDSTLMFQKRVLF